MKTPEHPSTLLDSFDDSEFEIAIATTVSLKENQGKHMFNTGHYLFIFAYSGEATLICDFKEVKLRTHQALIVRPNQMIAIHSSSDNAEGWVISFPAAAVSPTGQDSLKNLLIDDSPVTPDDDERNELMRLFEMLKERTSIEAGTTKGVKRLMAYTFAAIIIEVLVKRTKTIHPDRINGVSFIHQLYSLTDSELTHSRLPSHFAQLMGISASYLNERVRNLLGVNASLILRRESILRTARQLLTSPELTIREVASENGYSDPAYFTRLFRKITGLTPGEFRSRYTITEKINL